MRSSIIKKFLSLIFFLLLVQLSAQNLLPIQVSMKNGLSNNSINEIFIDNKDRTWISTDTDVYLYVSGNLYDFKTRYKVDILKCKDIIQDKNNDLWFASFGNGIYKYSDDTVINLNETNGLINNKVNKLYTKDNLVYIGTDNGISIYNIDTNTFVSPKIDQFKKYSTFSIVDFIELDNQVYFITLNDGFFKIINQQKIDPRIVKIRNHNYVTSLYLWKGYIYEARVNKIHVYTINDYLNNAGVLAEIPIGNVKNFHPRGERLAAVSAALYDNDGGLFIIRPDHTFREFVLKDDNIGRSYTSLAINAKTQKAYLGTQNDGFLVFDVDPNKAFFQSTNSTVNSFKEYKDKIVIVYNDKVEIKTRKDELLHQLSYNDILNQSQRDLKYHRVQFLNVEIHNDKLYLKTNIGTYALSSDLSTHQKISDSEEPTIFFKNELYNFDKHYIQTKNSFIGSLFVNNPNQLPHLLYESIVFDDKIIVSTKVKGLYLIENNKVTSLVHSKQFTESNINFIKKTKTNRLLVITDSNGIFEIDPYNNFNKTQHIAPCELVGKSIYFVDCYDSYYMVGTEVGVEFINSDKNRILNKDYGLPRANYTTGKVIGNILYVGGIGGYHKFNIQNFLKYDNAIQSIAIHGISSNNKNNNLVWTSNSSSNKLKVDSQQVPLVIKFIPYTLNNSGGHKVRYRINNESTWSNYSNDMLVQLVDLKEKEYNIELEFFDEINQSRQKIHLIDIEVKHSIWPKILYGLLAVFLIFCIKKLIQYLKYKQELLENITDLDFSIIEPENTKNELVTLNHIENFDEIAVGTKMLLNTINSHFMFNAINYLQYTILQNDKKESLRYNECFSTFFRSLLRNAVKPTVNIANEAEYINNYIELERSRFDYCIDFKFEIDESLDTHDIYIPTFILQPILEILLNYSYYGDIPRADITIVIQAFNTECIQISYIYNGNSIQEIETTKVNRFYETLVLMSDCISKFNNTDQHYFEYTSTDNFNKISFKLNV
jgi:hypothetical protein